jgi:uncharacterized membrane protein required for colicin V production
MTFNANLKKALLLLALPFTYGAEKFIGAVKNLYFAAKHAKTTGYSHPLKLARNLSLAILTLIVAIANAITGFAMGAAIGSAILPGVGTVIGGIIGAVANALLVGSVVAFFVKNIFKLISLLANKQTEQLLDRRNGGEQTANVLLEKGVTSMTNPHKYRLQGMGAHQSGAIARAPRQFIHNTHSKIRKFLHLAPAPTASRGVPSNI